MARVVLEARIEDVRVSPRLQAHRLILCDLVGVVCQAFLEQAEQGVALVGLEARSEDAWVSSRLQARRLILCDLVRVERQALVVLAAPVSALAVLVEHCVVSA